MSDGQPPGTHRDDRPGPRGAEEAFHVPVEGTRHGWTGPWGPPVMLPARPRPPLVPTFLCAAAGALTVPQFVWMIFLLQVITRR